MNHDYWLKRWIENRVGFHRDQPNRLLEQFLPQLAADPEARVLIPLCGKSVDLKWLADRGHPVVGVDLSQIAAKTFASEQHLAFEVAQEPPFTVLHSERITFYVGDFFELTPKRAGTFQAIWDRAALIALPRDRRPAYAAHLRSLLAPGGRILLVTLEYDEREMDGPPFSVPDAEARALFPGRPIEELAVRDCLDEEPHFRERGLTWLRERAFLVR